MYDLRELGKTISELRKKAGYSQKTLAAELNITDKAVSKWERGLSCPDVSLLPRLSVLLDSDIEPMLAGLSTISTDTWKGILILKDFNYSLLTVIYDKPLVYYLIANFLLVGITEVTIVCRPEQTAILESVISNICEDIPLFINYSTKIDEEYCNNNDIFLINDAVFLFAVSLTRQYLSFMSYGENYIEVVQSTLQSTPLYFYPRGTYSKKENKINRKLGRGTICIPLCTLDNIQDASIFVKMFQSYHNCKIADLKEICQLRGILLNQ